MALGRFAASFAVGLLAFGVACARQAPPRGHEAQPRTWEARAKVVTVPVLMVHRVRELAPMSDEPSFTWSVAPRALDAHLGALAARGYRSVTMKKLGEALRGGEAVPERAFVLTFDDGWSSDVEVALPILRRHGFVATFYVFPGSLGDPDRLSWASLRELHEAGMEIGSHTLSHPHLPALASGEQRREIEQSRSTLEAFLGVPVTTFAYPYGEHDAAVRALVQGAGYETAVTTEPGYRPRGDEALRIPRIRVAYRESTDGLLSLLPP